MQLVALRWMASAAVVVTLHATAAWMTLNREVSAGVMEVISRPGDWLR